MTKKQKEVMDFLKDYLKKNGVAPTMKEVGKYFNVSIPSVQSHFKNLEKKGYLTRTPNNSRGIIIKANPKKVVVTSELIKKIQELENRIANLELSS